MQPAIGMPLADTYTHDQLGRSDWVQPEQLTSLLPGAAGTRPATAFHERARCGSRGAGAASTLPGNSLARLPPSPRSFALALPGARPAPRPLRSDLYFWLVEGGLADTVFATAVTLAVAAAIVCIGRRVLVAAVLVVAMIGIVRTISYAKQQASEVVLHAYDLVTFLRSWSGLHEVWSEHRPMVTRRRDRGAGCGGGELACGAPRCASRASSLRGLRACSFRRRRLDGRHGAEGRRRHTEFYFENAYVTFFYTSWSETAQALWRGRLIEAAGPRAMSAAAGAPRASRPAPRQRSRRTSFSFIRSPSYRRHFSRR